MGENREQPDSLAARVRARGFTPASKDVPAVVALLADDAAADAAEAALVRKGADVVPLALDVLAGSPAKVRARLYRVLADVAPGDGAAHTALLAGLQDADLRVRRLAALGLARTNAEQAEHALLEAWQRAERIEEKRTLAEALGHCGKDAALRVLRAIETEDTELRRRVDRSILMMQRDRAREARGAIDLEVSIDAPIVFRCRQGLESFVCEELDGTWKARMVAPGVVRASLRGPLSAAFRSRVAMHMAFPLDRVHATHDRAADVVALLTSPASRLLLDSLTRGPKRVRVAWEDAGHRRAIVWRTAKLLAETAPDIINDPRDAVWELVVRERHDGIEGDLVPRALTDSRFAYRVAEVPAASHPTIAAALARAAGVRNDDIVWDPFVGSGLELIERARLGPYRALLGTDLDEDACSAARKNLAAAGVEAPIVCADALTFAPERVTLILTNPPMGRRVPHASKLRELLDGVVRQAAMHLAPGGRLVWLSPQPGRTAARAREAGLLLDQQRTVEMGGFSAELQRLSKPPAP